MIIMAIIIGALGAIGRGFRTLLGKLQLENFCSLMQKTCLSEQLRSSESSWIPKVVCYILLSNKYQSPK